MTAQETAENGDEDGGVVVPLHGARSKRPDKAPDVPWRAFDSAARDDRLTSLHGHPWFEEDLRGAGRRRRDGENPWVAISSVDGLAEVEESGGPDAAAEALRAVAVRLRDSLRAGDKIARLDEASFGLIVDAPYAGEAISALERIERSVRELVSTHPSWLAISLHVGIAPLWGADPEAALRQAQGALVTARRRGSPVVMSTESRP